MRLYATDDNPIPEGASVAAVRAADGTRLRAARWAAAAPQAGTVLLLQGRAEMIEKYFETIGELRARGFDVVTFDWRGQGGSDRLLRDPRRGHVGDFSDYAADLRAVVESEMAGRPKPWFGLCHSMGACVALAALHERALPIERAVCVAPMVAVHGIRNPAGVLRLARFLKALGLGGRYIPGGGPVSIATKPFEGNPLSADVRRYARNARIASTHPELAIGDPTIGWTRAAFARMAEMANPRYAAEIDTPALILAAGDDRVVSTPAIEAFAGRLKAGGVIVVPEARHELLMERDAVRSQFFAAFDAFVADARATPRAAAAGTRRG